MTDGGNLSFQERILLVAPTPRDAALGQSILGEAGLACAVCPDISALCRELEAGAGAVMLTEEALGSDEVDQLVDSLNRQPSWSDMTIAVLTRGGADSPVAAQAMEKLGNIILLERPVRVNTLVTTLRTALRARYRQYQIRDYLL